MGLLRNDPMGSIKNGKTSQGTECVCSVGLSIRPAGYTSLKRLALLVSTRAQM